MPGRNARELPKSSPSGVNDFDMISSDEESSSRIPSSLRRYAVIAFAVMGICSIIGVALTRTKKSGGSTDSPGVRGSQYQAPEDAHEDISMKPKPASDSWSFDLELVPQKIELPNGVVFDPSKVPQLYSQGCEDTPGWTNGYNCAADPILTKSLGPNALNGSLCKPTGYTCAAYAVGGWCEEKWASGPFSHNPHQNCCACGGGTSVMQLTADCGKATGQCAKAVHYAMYVGIKKHPDRYPGLSKSSSYDDFQKHLHDKDAARSECPLPCNEGVNPPVAPVAATNADDADSAPITDADSCPYRNYDDARKGPAFCFAQLGDNAGVKGLPCSCRQGCDPEKTLLATTNDTVTFANMKGLGNTKGACSKEVILTIPRSYYKHYDDVKERCGHNGLVKMVEVIMRDAFNAYNNKLCPSALWQCFHSPRTASVPFIHMQTFSAAGFFHGMPTSNRGVASCVRQSSLDETRDLAVKLASMM